ncbi:hypothetical protein QFC22_003177 [Naganishia vaughanmartiniae]|uniref:Uncharacterized protein n=1 Tax=Naganishia vaughanmartiniae TaxID=1424756 RepID=A0ACC2X8P4_9TREE|nr:hypothetical protein QFC22_003177 [Naganishia vaughanmartiniae]
MNIWCARMGKFGARDYLVPRFSLAIARPALPLVRNNLLSPLQTVSYDVASHYTCLILTDDMPAFPVNTRALGLPKRWIIVGSFFTSIIVLTLVSSHPPTRQFVAERTPDAAKALHPANWGLPFAGTGGADSGSRVGGIGSNRPPEFDEYGRCLFMSPFDALSIEEKQRAEQLVLETASDGVVRAREAVFVPPSKKKGNSTMPDAQVKETLTNPILGLLRDGERKWQDMLSQQSTTLEEAVIEYKTRWGRNPPRGFDEWWEFASNRGVLLPDEYDSYVFTVQRVTSA